MRRYGLDFGTTNSSISTLEKGFPRLVSIDTKALDPTVIRSLLYFYHRDLVLHKMPNKKEEWLYSGDFHYEIGQAALEQYLLDNKNRKPGVVRQIFTGRMLNINMSPEAGKADLVAEYYDEIDYGTGRLMQALKTALKSPVYKGTRIFGKYFTLEQMIGLFVSLIKKSADDMLGENIEAIKVGRPVHFLDDVKKDKAVETRLAEGLKMVGFKKIDFEFEPVAAAKYFLYKNALQKQKVFVFDFGGGTLDTAIVEYTSGFKVHATDGIYIGGNLLNSDIMAAKLNKYFGSEILWGERQNPLPVHIMENLDSWYAIANLNNPGDMRFLDEIRLKNSDPQALERLIYLIKMNLGFALYENIEQAKKELSTQDTTQIKYFDGPININLELTRPEFETLIAPRIEAIKQVVLRTLKSAKTDPEEIGVVVRTGGSSLIPLVETMLSDIFGKDKVQQFDTFTSIAAGLAIEDMT